jgi:hypothetical protein
MAESEAGCGGQQESLCRLNGKRATAVALFFGFGNGR